MQGPDRFALVVRRGVFEDGAVDLLPGLVRDMLPDGDIGERIGNERAGEGIREAAVVLFVHATVPGRTGPADHQLDPVVLAELLHAPAARDVPRPLLAPGLVRGAVLHREQDDAGPTVRVEVVPPHPWPARARQRERPADVLPRGDVVVEVVRHRGEQTLGHFHPDRVAPGVRGASDAPPVRADEGPVEHLAPPAGGVRGSGGRLSGQAGDPVALDVALPVDHGDAACPRHGLVGRDASAVRPHRLARPVRQLPRQVQTPVPALGDGQHDRDARRCSVQVGRDQFDELVGGQVACRTVRPPRRHAVVAALGHHGVREPARSPRGRPPADLVEPATGTFPQDVDPADVQSDDLCRRAPVDTRDALAVHREVTGPLPGDQSLHEGVVRAQRPQAVRPAVRVRVEDQRGGPPAFVVVHQGVLAAVEDAADQIVRVEPRVPQLGVGVGQVVQQLQRPYHLDRHLTAQRLRLRARGEPGIPAATVPLDGEVIDREPLVGGDVRLAAAQFGVQARPERDGRVGRACPALGLRLRVGVALSVPGEEHVGQMGVLALQNLPGHLVGQLLQRLLGVLGQVGAVRLEGQPGRPDRGGAGAGGRARHRRGVHRQ